MSDPKLELQNPQLPALRLSQLANQYPQLWNEIAAHPNSYPSLRDWIARKQAYAQQLAAASQQGAAGVSVTTAQASQQVSQAASASGAYGAQALPQPSVQSQPQQYQQVQQAQPLQQYQQPQQDQPMQQVQSVQPQQVTVAGTAKSSKNTAKVLIAAIVAVLLVASIGIVFVMGMFSRGSATPEDAAHKFVNGFLSFNQGDIYKSFAPSEFKSFEDSLKKLSSTSLRKGGTNIDSLGNELSSSIKISTEDLKSEQTEVIPDQVTRVTFKSGKIKISADREKLKATINKFAEANYPSAGAANPTAIVDQMFPPGQSERTIDIVSYGDIPFGGRINGVVDYSPDKAIIGEFSLVSVKESDGKWYVSPLMTIAEMMYVQGGHDLKNLGTRIVDAADNSSPEQAIKGLAEAVAAQSGSWEGYIKNIAAQLPLAERRVLSVYAVNLKVSMDNRGSNGPPHVSSQRYSSERNGSTARIKIEEIAFSSRNGNEKMIIQGSCVEQKRRDYFSRHCMKDIPMATELHLDKIAAIAVEENGKWHVSAIATAADVYATATNRLVELLESGEFEKLLYQKIYQNMRF
ncbi:MAG: hypothetical protein Q4C71_02115 [Microbacteriaceae bacterium]|nr:hypothetical protein [Microbacteriaceae bacterium]